MIGVVVGIVLAGGAVVLVGVFFILRSFMEDWGRVHRRKLAALTRQVEALNSLLRVELAGRRAQSQISQLMERGGERR